MVNIVSTVAIRSKNVFFANGTDSVIVYRSNRK